MFYPPLSLEVKPWYVFIGPWLEIVLAPVTAYALWWLLKASGPMPRFAAAWFWLFIGTCVVAFAGLFTSMPFSTGIVGIADERTIRYWANPWIVIIPFRIGAMMAAALIIGLRLHLLEADERRDQSLMAGALLLYPPLLTASNGAFFQHLLGVVSPRLVWAGAASIVLAIVWLIAAHRTRTRSVALVGYIGLVATTVGILIGSDPRALQIGPAVARLAEMALISYALLRHDFLGLDAHIRFGISKTTVAAIFVAVFFIASEAAQAFFGERFQSEYLGIAAAGVLVLAIAPLQRMADRMAERAVPTARESNTDSAVLRALARRLGADGELSADDRRMLVATGQEMGLAPLVVHDVIADVDSQRPRRP